MKNYKFDVYEPVLVRNTENAPWVASLFSNIVSNIPFTNDDCRFVTINGSEWRFCVPFKGNEHILGTTNKAAPKWIPQQNEIVKVFDNGVCLYRRFKQITDNGEYECYYDGSNTETSLWKRCEPLTSEERGE